MKCKDCVYYYHDIDEFEIDGKMQVRAIGDAYCHYRYNDGYAPCEIEDSYDEPEEHDWFEAYEEDE